MKLKQILSIVLAFSLGVSSASGAVLEKSFHDKSDLKGMGGGAEFIVGDFPGAVLMSINLWGAVGKAGIYYLPADTDLVTLLSYAGGPTSKAIIDEIIIRRQVKGKEKFIEVDLEEILSTVNTKPPVLEANDIVMIPAEEPLFNPNMLQAIGFLSGIMAVVLTSLVLSDRLSDK